MIRASVRTISRFPAVALEIDETAARVVNAASETMATVAQANASIDLKIKVIRAKRTETGWAGGIKATRQTSTAGKTTPIAHFFDRGTLGNRTVPTKRPRKQSWRVNRRGSTYTAHRRPVSEASGVRAEHFFVKARAAGRAAAVSTLSTRR